MKKFTSITSAAACATWKRRKRASEPSKSEQMYPEAAVKIERPVAVVPAKARATAVETAAWVLWSEQYGYHGSRTNAKMAAERKHATNNSGATANGRNLASPSMPHTHGIPARKRSSSGARFPPSTEAQQTHVVLVSI